MSEVEPFFVTMSGYQHFLEVPQKQVEVLDLWHCTDAAYPCAKCVSTGATLTSRLTKRFEGDDWHFLVDEIPALLRQTFVCEASEALAVSSESIFDVEFRLGSLYVTFHVTHDEDISQEEMDRRIEEYPFREMWRLYNQRDGAPDGLDAALQRIKAMEAELKEKEREMDKERGDHEQRLNKLEQQLRSTEDELKGPVAERERDLTEQLGKEQAGRKKADGQLRAVEEQNKKLLDALKQEKARFERTSQRHNDLIAAIIQENKKEKEAKEREFHEQLDVKDYIIENLKSQLRTRTTGDPSPRNSIYENDQSEELSKLMSRMEEMTLILQKAQESESEAHAQIQRISDSLKRSEEARQAESVTYENNILALRQQLNAYRETGLAEEHEKRSKENRQLARGSVSQAVRENEVIVRQYETALENIIGTLQDRLHIVREEYGSYLAVAEKEVAGEKSVLEEHEEDSKAIRQTFRSSSIALQKIYWGTREGEVPHIIHDLDSAAAGAEKSSAAVKVAMAMLDSKIRTFTDQREWMEAHQTSLQELIESLRALNKRAFERQLTLMSSSSSKETA